MHMILHWEELLVVFEIRADEVERADCATAWNVENNLIISVELHEYEVFVDENNLVKERLRGEALLLRPHELVQVRRENLDHLVSEGVQHFDLMSMALDVDIVMEGRREEIHWDTSVKGPQYIVDCASFLVELCDFEDVVFRASMLRKDQVVVRVQVEVHLLRADNLRELDDLPFRDNLHANVLKVHRLLVLALHNSPISEQILTLISHEFVLVQLMTVLKLASDCGPGLDLRVTRQHMQVFVSSCLVEDRGGLVVGTA